MHIFTVDTATSPCQSLFQRASTRLVSRDVYHVPTSSHSRILTVSEIFTKQWVKHAASIFYFVFPSLEMRRSTFSYLDWPLVFLYSWTAYLYSLLVFPFFKNLTLKSSSYVLHNKFWLCMPSIISPSLSLLKIFPHSSFVIWKFTTFL